MNDTILSAVTPSAEVGVIVGRFQVPYLHDGHRSLISTVQAKHSRVLILVGSRPGVKASASNPLDYHTRMLMLREVYPDVSILPLHDMPSDKTWSESLDSRVYEAFGCDTAVIYGSRDAFIPHYQGKHPTVELAAAGVVSGTEIRAVVGESIRQSMDFRCGVIYASTNRHPVMFSTVDVVPVSYQEDGSLRIAVGRKLTDAPGRWRFLGGFVDPQQDSSLRDAARRESAEEAPGFALDDFEYLDSLIVDDWRYRGERDSIMTNVFIARYLHGAALAGDDLNELTWAPLDDSDTVRRTLVTGHQPIFDLVYNRLLGGSK